MRLLLAKYTNKNAKYTRHTTAQLFQRSSHKCLFPQKSGEECFPPGGWNAFLALRSLTLAAVTQNLPVLQCRAAVPPRMQQSAAAAAVQRRSSVVQPAAAGLRPLQSTPGRGCSALCSRGPALGVASDGGCSLDGGLQCSCRPPPTLQCYTQHAAALPCTPAPHSKAITLLNWRPLPLF